MLSDRREFLRGAAASGGALVLSALLPGMPGRAAGTASSHAIGAWVRIADGGSVTLIASQSEMGQGITTTLAAALADELYLPMSAIRIEFATFDPAYRDPVYQWMFTGNSQGASSFYSVMRKMGAAARQMLLDAGAVKLGVPANSLSMRDGVIHHEASKRSVRFADVAAAAAKLPVPANPRLRVDSAYSGKSLARLDVPSKVDGSAVFGIDVKLPGMLCAAVRCAPRFGSKLIRYDAARIKAHPGVAAVVEVPSGLAVVAQTYWQARRALDGAELQWSDEGSSLTCGDSLPAVYYEKLAGGELVTHKQTGSSASAHSSVATYEVPFQAHATMEPMNCTAHVRPDRCEIWAPTQGMEMAQNVAMQVTGLPGERITIHRTLLGGGFGRRLLADFLKQSLLIAKVVQRPVKLIWSREEDMTHDFYRPAMLHRITGSVSAAGSLESLAHRVVSPSHMLYIMPRGLFPGMKDWSAPAAPPVKMDVMGVEGLLDIPYAIANQRIEQHRLEVDVPVSVWRTTGHGPNNFVLESFIDELAHAAHRDPLEFRRAALKGNARALKVLDTLAAKAKWNGTATNHGVTTAALGRGIALASAFNGLIAAAVDLSVTDSQVRIHRIVTVVDCGRTLDPGIAESNILGGIVWGLSGMRTAITFNQGKAVETNFNAFAPLHLHETPPCEVHFIESGAPIGGTGELGPVPIHAAVCNAIFVATGKRLRALPLSKAGLSFA